MASQASQVRRRSTALDVYETSLQMTIKRIHREIADLQKEDMGDITLEPFGDSLYLFKGSIPGPEGSVYEGGLFHLDMQLPPDYPFTAPKVMFKTRIYHMNISDQGGICIDILKHNWSPALSLYKVMLSLSSLLTDPNPKDPLVPTIANQYVRNRAVHDSTAREWTAMYAMPPPPRLAPSKTRAPAAAVEPPSPKARGKMRDPAPSAGGPSSSSRSSRQITTVDDEYSDVELAVVAPSRSTRKRKAVQHQDENNEVIDLSSDAESVKPSPRTSKRAKRDGRRPKADEDEDDVIVLSD